MIGEAFGFELEDTSYARVLPNSILLKIDAEVYEPIVTILYFIEQKNTYDFFSSIPLFEKMYRYSLDVLVSSMKEVSFGFNEVVYEESKSIEHIYLVKEG